MVDGWMDWCIYPFNGHLSFYCVLTILLDVGCYKICFCRFFSVGWHIHVEHKIVLVMDVLAEPG